MSILSNLINKLTGSHGTDTTVVPIEFASIGNYKEIDDGQHVRLFEDRSGGSAKYLIILVPPIAGKTWRVLSLADRNTACDSFRLYRDILNPLTQIYGEALNTKLLQKICIAIHNTERVLKNFKLTFLCVQLRLLEILNSRHDDIIGSINHKTDQLETPLLLACKDEACPVEYVETLLNLGAEANICDFLGNTPVHYAAKHSKEKLQILLKVSQDMHLNEKGQTPVYVACENNQEECLKLLIEHAGADTTITGGDKAPIHIASHENFTNIVDMLCEVDERNINLQDLKHGATPLHHVKSREMIDVLMKYNVEVNWPSNSGDTPLHIMLKYQRLDCVFELLTVGADPSLINDQSETALLLAIPKADLTLVRILLAFGADPNICNNSGESPRHIASNEIKDKKLSDDIVYALHAVGAERCGAGMRVCDDRCHRDGNSNGKEISEIDSSYEHTREVFDDLVLGTSQSDSSLNLAAESERAGPFTGDKVLCLDGGGIRGMILAITLMTIEQRLQYKIADYFDWISGTSTGGILALALTNGRSARYCIGLYFKLKEDVFKGRKPYDTQVLEDLLKEEFGEEKNMSELTGPKVMIPTMMVDRYPPEFHFFKNYDNPIDSILSVDARMRREFEPPPERAKTPIWLVARSTGAAPYYFRSAQGKYIDGGLMANNPTCDCLTEIQEYNSGLRTVDRQDDIVRLSMVLSIGTGRIPQTKLGGTDLYWPTSVSDIIHLGINATKLLDIILEQASQSEGRPVERARAMCAMSSIPFFRFSPQLSVRIELDEKNNEKLALMCWETVVYLHQQKHRVDTVVNMLNQLGPRTKKLHRL